MKLQGGCHDDKHTKDHHEEEHEIHARCEIMPNKEITDLAYRVRGHVKLSQKPGQDNISLDYNLRNLIPSHSHAVHIHEGGNMERCCDSLGGHYNPHRKQHGLPSSDEAFDSHVGDLGNVAADDGGNHVSEQTMHADLLDMIGRSFVIHEGTDTGEGNQGRKIACCVIGRAHENHHDDHSHHSHHGDQGHHNHHHHDDHEHDGNHDHSNHHHHNDQSRW
uniref:Extracellular Cu/Zn superoxide dismutase n=1 Tax=Argopecten irradians TaxID=31199 RepID=C5H405_ARGIR|nr:extracellular Cu/Zn superoxide dismutase [Argopecten irradians]ACK38046.1 extracellular copper/zinc superoxide dismutase [Argopecten irradians]